MFVDEEGGVSGNEPPGCVSGSVPGSESGSKPPGGVTGKVLSFETSDCELFSVLKSTRYVFMLLWSVKLKSKQFTEVKSLCALVFSSFNFLFLA